MIRRSMAVALALMVMFALLLACATTFTRDSYRALTISNKSYDVALNGMGDLYREGVIDDGIKDQAIKYGRAFMKAHNGAVEALAVYEEQGGDANKQAALVAMQEASKALADLIRYARPYLQKYGKEVP